MTLDPADESLWSRWAAEWQLRPDSLYLNHGSFGPPPRSVKTERQRWQQALDEQPMDFFFRLYEPAWLHARKRLAEFMSAEETSLVFVENATDGMNQIANAFPLEAGDEVLLTDHEYGAVVRIWERRCAQVNAKVCRVELPWPVQTQEELAAAVLNGITPRTRLVVVSHITSPTALELPVKAIAAECRRRGVALCIDGPHALLQTEVSLREIDCDFYTASCHKWLCAPFGSGFLHVAPRWQERFHPSKLSWGRLQPAVPHAWWEEFIWSGTRDSSPYFAIPSAIDFAREIGEGNFRRRTHYLAQFARHEMEKRFPLPPFIPDDVAFYGSMALVPLPAGESFPLQKALWERFQIEVPIVSFRGGRFVRISCHLYNKPADYVRLADAMQQLVQQVGM